jgi:hypothetical protein
MQAKCSIGYCPTAKKTTIVSQIKSREQTNVTPDRIAALPNF